MNLTDRQTEVVRGIASGKTVKEIAFDTGISSKAVEYHVSRVRTKVGVNCNVLLAHWAIAKRLVPLAFCLVLMGCETPPGPVSPPLPTMSAGFAERAMSRADAGAASAPAVQVGDTVTLAWDASTSSVNGYWVYIGTNTTWSKLNFVTGTNVVVTNVFAPVKFQVTAIDAVAESIPSNTLTLLGKTNTITVTGEHAPAASGAWTKYAVPVYDGPASSNAQFFRLKITNSKQWNTLSTP